MEAFDGRVEIAQYFRDCANWQRQRVASEYLLPGDDATTADAFARFVLSLPDCDRRVETLRRLTVMQGDCVVSPGPRFSSALASILHCGTSGFDVFLDHLVHAAIDDAIQSSRQPFPLLIDEPAAIAQEALLS